MKDKYVFIFYTFYVFAVINDQARVGLFQCFEPHSLPLLVSIFPHVLPLRKSIYLFAIIYTLFVRKYKELKKEKRKLG